MGMSALVCQGACSVAMLGQHSLNASHTDPSMAPRNIGDDAEVSNEILFALSAGPAAIADCIGVRTAETRLSDVAGWLGAESAVGISDTT